MSTPEQEHKDFQKSIQDFVAYTDDKICTVFEHPETKEIDFVIVSGHDSQDRVQEYMFDQIYLDTETIKWLQETTKEEREDLVRVAKISRYKKEIQKLESELEA